MRSNNKVMAGDSTAVTAVISTQTAKETVSGSFAHLRASAAIGPDRRSLVNFYRNDNLGKVAPHYPEESTSIGETDELCGSIDKGLVTPDWEDALCKLSMHGEELLGFI